MERYTESNPKKKSKSASTTDFFNPQITQINKVASRLEPFRQIRNGVFVILNVEMDSSVYFPFDHGSELIKILEICQNNNIQIGIQHSPTAKESTAPSPQVVRVFLSREYNLQILSTNKTKQVKERYENKQVIIIERKFSLEEVKRKLEPHINGQFSSEKGSAVKIPEKYYRPIELLIMDFDGTLIGITGHFLHYQQSPIKYPEFVELIRAHEQNKFYKNSLRSGGWGIATSKSNVMNSDANTNGGMPLATFREFGNTLDISLYSGMISVNDDINDIANERFQRIEKLHASPQVKEKYLLPVKGKNAQIQRLIHNHYANVKLLYGEDLQLEPHQVLLLDDAEENINYAKQMGYSTVLVPRDDEKELWTRLDHFWELQDLLRFTEVIEKRLNPSSREFPELAANEKDNKFLCSIRNYYLILQNRTQHQIPAPLFYSKHDIAFPLFIDINDKFDVDLLYGLQSVNTETVQEFLKLGDEISAGKSLITDVQVTPKKSIYHDNGYLLPSLKINGIQTLSEMLKRDEISGINIMFIDKNDKQLIDFLPYYKNIKGLKASDHVTVFPYPIQNCAQGQPINIAFIQLNDNDELSLNTRDLQLLFPFFNAVQHTDKNKMPLAICSIDPLFTKQLFAIIDVHHNFRTLKDEAQMMQLNSKLQQYDLPLEAKFKAFMFGVMLKAIHLETWCVQTFKSTFTDEKNKRRVDEVFSPEKSDREKKESINKFAMNYLEASITEKYSMAAIAEEQSDETKVSSANDNISTKKSDKETKARTWSARSQRQPSQATLSLKHLNDVLTVKIDLRRCLNDYAAISSHEQSFSPRSGNK